MRVTVIDSGLGGIAFSRNIKVDIKYLDIKLLIDKEGFPYGDKELSWIKERLLSLVESCNTNTIIIACNTLSSLIFHYNLEFNKTVVDVITPTIYFLLSKNYQKVCILATKNTIKMNVYQRLLDSEVIYLDASKLIFDLQMKDNYQSSLFEIIKLIPKGCDSLVLGCTHLIEIKDEFRKELAIDVVSQDEIFISLFK